MPIFLHGPVATALARERYGIEDPEILEAVRVHTTGSAGMGPVARIVFLADKLDPTKDRRYPFNSEVRQVAATDLNRAIRLFLDGDISGHVAGGRVVHLRERGSEERAFVVSTHAAHPELAESAPLEHRRVERPHPYPGNGSKSNADKEIGRLAEHERPHPYYLGNCVT